MFALKPLSHESVTGALAKAEHYRLLGEPAEAESICRDIVEIEPENQAALICLMLALSDQIAHDSRAFGNAVALLERLDTSPVIGFFYMTSGLSFLVGGILLGIALFRTADVPRWAGPLLGVSLAPNCSAGPPAMSWPSA